MEIGRITIIVEQLVIREDIYGLDEGSDDEGFKGSGPDPVDYGDESHLSRDKKTLECVEKGVITLIEVGIA